MCIQMQPGRLARSFAAACVVAAGGDALLPHSPLRLDGVSRERSKFLVLRQVGELLARQPGVDLDGIAVRAFVPQLMQRGSPPGRPRRLYDRRTEVAGPMKEADHGPFVPDIDAEMIGGVVMQRLAIRDEQNEVEMKIVADECGRSIRPLLRPGRAQPGIQSNAARYLRDSDAGVKLPGLRAWG